MVELSTFGRAYESEFMQLGLDAPTWVTDNNKTLRREITNRKREQMEARLKDLKARKASLRTVDEKRIETDKEIENLETALG
jgi:hypothetical protein